MPTNPYINNFGQTQEKSLMENLIIESIKFYGQEMHWIPRKTVNEDQIFGEDTLSKFDVTYPIELYIKNVEGFEGEGDFISRFGLEIRDQITFTMAQRRFEELGSEFPRPREADLIYFPLNKKLYEIMFVEHEAIFYQAGDLPVYDLQCELFRYSSEKIDTGIVDIDKLEDDFSQVVTADDETSMPDSSTADNKSIEDAADSILDFDDSNPFGSF
jgi:hypothetical protein